MTRDGGGWTMIASTTDEDDVTNWIGDAVSNWTNDVSFGDIDSFDIEDYKSPVYYRLTDVGDILFVDSNEDWLSFSGLMFDSLANTMSNHSSCQTSTIPFVSRNSSDPLLVSIAEIAFNPKDPNGSRCAIDPYAYDTSAMIALAGNGCAMMGFGQEVTKYSS